ncbi:MAG: SRPBCC domain-containing protein, partial [bacterium]
ALIDAPRERVFQAWTDPEQLAQWFGPRDFTTAIPELDVHPGGRFRIVMRDADGVEYPISGVYTEVVPPEWLVYRNNLAEHPAAWKSQLDARYHKHGGEGDVPLETVARVTFDERGEKTLVTLRTEFDTLAARNTYEELGMTEGWQQSLDRLNTLVGAGTPSQR